MSSGNSWQLLCSGRTTSGFARRQRRRKARLDVERLEQRETPAISIVEFGAGLSADSGLNDITPGPDGNLWFTQFAGNRIGRVTPAGQITELVTLDNAGLREIVAGPDGNLWFTEQTANRIGQITPGGTVSHFTTGLTAGGGPIGMALGSDGNLWFTENFGNRIGRITPAGNIQEFTDGISGSATPEFNLAFITPGPDGNLWFTASANNLIGRITPAGQVMEFPLPDFAGLEDITAGPDGNLWFVEPGLNRIGQMSTAGVLVNEFDIPTAGAEPHGIAVGPDGNLWFTELQANRIGRITPSGTVTEFPRDGSALQGSQPSALTLGPDGNLWFIEAAGNQIGRISGIMSFGPASLPAATAGSLYDQTITVTGGTTPYTALTVTGFDAGATGLATPTTNAAAGTVRLNSTPTAPGTARFTVNVTDSAGDTATRSYTVTVTGIAPANRPPVLSPISNQTVTEGTTLSFTAQASDPDGNPLQFSLGAGAPAGTAINGTSGAFTWTPATDQGPAVYTITVIVSDNATPALSDSETIQVTVNDAPAANQPPVLAAIGPRTITEGNLLSFTAQASDPDSNSLSFSLAGGAPAGAAISAGGVFTWTPSADQGPGVFNITVIVTDNGNPALTDSETVQVTVNDAPASTPPAPTPPAPTPSSQPAQTELRLSATVDVAVFGQAVTFSAAVTAADGATPAGLVKFLDGSRTLGTAPLINGTARFTTTALAVGQHSIQAVFSGDASFSEAAATRTATVTRFARQPDPRRPGKLVAGIAGTARRDTFKVTALRGGALLRVEVRNGSRLIAVQTFATRNLSQVLIYGTPGLDRLLIAPGVKIRVAFAPRIKVPVL